MDAFKKLHAQVDSDPLKELRRRQQMWASAPDSRGEPLNACIVPDATVVGAIEEIERLRREVADFKNVLRRE